jgi:arylsulfatase A
MNLLRTTLFLVLCAAGAFAAEERLPNIVLIFADDLGYGDLGVYGAKGYSTPHIDRLARRGRRLTSFYAAQPVCSASRAALLTGCYPNRIGLYGALGPRSKIGIHSNEVTLAELVKQKEYSTAIFGKWHLGVEPEFLPTRHGFDLYFGLPYSNDMWPFHPEAKTGTYPDLPLIEGERNIARNPDQTQLTRQYTERAVQFIRENRSRPFLLYLAHSMPHVPLFASKRFAGKTSRGLFGDVVQEIDWSVGEVMDALRSAEIDRNTLVIFTSDNGPWLSYGDHAGSAGPFREGKGTVWEGGVRVPCIVSWPGRIPENTETDQPAMAIDLFATIARLISAQLPTHKIDGSDIWPLLSNTTEEVNQERPYFFYYNVNDLLAVRQGRWKLYLPQEYRTLGGRPGGTNGIPAKYEMRPMALSLYDLEDDPGERNNLAPAHPEVVRQLEKLVASMREDLGDDRTKVPGKGRREPGRVE